MTKTLIITVMVDGVDLEDLKDIQKEVETVFVGYDDKRITIQIQDEPLVTRQR